MASTMKAYVITRPGNIELVDSPIPTIDRESLLLQTKRVSICGTDVGYYRGYLFPVGWPVIPGHEYVGEVVEKGLADSSVKVGDKVVYWGETRFGGFAEFREIKPILPGTRDEKSWYTERGFTGDGSAAAVVLDDEISLDDASLLEPLTSVLRALLVHPPTPGDNAIVLGAGPCGLIAMQLLKKYQGAHSVTVLDTNPQRLEFASRLGADRIFNVDTEHPDLMRIARDSQGKYAQYVFDALPDIVEDLDEIPIPRNTAVELLAPGHQYIVYGDPANPQPIARWLILSKDLKVHVTSCDAKEFPVWRTADVLAVAKEILSHGVITLSPIISHLVDFYDASSIKAAFQRHGTGSRLKTVASLELG